MRKKRGSAIVITVSNKIEVKQLLANGFCFEEVVKKEERYQEAGPGLVYIKCCGISYKRQDSYENRPKKCVIYVEVYLTSKYQCGVNKQNKKKGKLYIYFIA